MKDQLAWAMYSHSSYSDVWPMFIGQANTHRFPIEKSHIIVDSKGANQKLALEFGHIHRYQDSDSYADRMLFALQSIEEEFILYCHEDMVLYGDIDMGKINSYVKAMECDPLVDWIKLIRGGEQNLMAYGKGQSTLYESKGTYPFAIQPAIYRVSSLINFLTGNNALNIWELEEVGNKWCRENKAVSLYSYDGESSRGMHHSDSSVFPYVATAIVKGKWNWFEYEEILPKLLDKYNIDRNLRGIV